ncbi:unnamed protein product [Dicrocoelium dendriticum]|nr:unnamed protein product [Dicrocoelium dendriticum]CAH8659239.1 unnamed protein product [Dicrocoelium dendriticum]
MQQQLWFDDGSAPGGPSFPSHRSASLLAGGNKGWTKFTDNRVLDPFPMYHVTGAAEGTAKTHPLSHGRHSQEDYVKHSYLDLSELSTEQLPANGFLPRPPRSTDTQLDPRIHSTLRYSSNPSKHHMLELTKRHRKLDHLQRCLQRYEIERLEAGQAVLRIEQRLKELQERTADLLDYSSEKHRSDKEPWMTNPMQIPRIDRHQGAYHRSGPANNQLYLDTEQMLNTTSRHVPKSPLIQPEQVYNAGHNCVANQRRRDQHQNDQCRPSPGKQALSDRSLLAELEAYQGVLTNHLTRQLGRLAAADATVLNLAGTLMQMGIGSSVKEDHCQLADAQMTPDYPPKAKLNENVKHPTELHADEQNALELTPPNTKSMRKQGMDCKGESPSAEALYFPLPTTVENIPLLRNPSQFERPQPQLIRPVPDRLPQAPWPAVLPVNSHQGPFSGCPTRQVYQPVNTEYTQLFESDSAPMSSAVSGLVLSTSNTQMLRSAFQLPLQVQLVAAMPRRGGFVSSAERGPESAPPLPPKRNPNVAYADEPQTIEDEEVSKLMSTENMVTNEQEQGKQTGSKFMDPTNVQRPPPPPYYVNLTAAATETRSSPVFDLRRLEDVATIITPIQRSLSIVECNSNANNRLEVPKQGMRRYVRPSTINLRHYLKHRGYALEELIVTEEFDWKKLVTPTSNCFQSVFVRWFRTSFNRNSSEKTRGRKLAKDGSVSTSSEPGSDCAPCRTPEFRVIMTNTKCEGFLFLWHSNCRSARHRSPPWRSMRETDHTKLQGERQSRTSKNWRQKWFICDLEYRILSYYDDQGAMKQKNCIPLSTIQTVFAAPEISSNSSTPSISPKPRWPHRNVDNGTRDPGGRRSTNSEASTSSQCRASAQCDEAHTSNGIMEDSWTSTIFCIDSTTRFYTLRTTSAKLRNMWMAVIDFGRRRAIST